MPDVMSNVLLIPVEYLPDAPNDLYCLLREREEFESISHKAMPSFEDHYAFFKSRPYLAWCMIATASLGSVGCVYLSHQREIGVSIFRQHRGQGYATAAIKLLMEKHPGKFLANINPANDKSIKLFAKLGFNLIQHTYSYE